MLDSKTIAESGNASRARALCITISIYSMWMAHDETTIEH
jgi:hypothetical protein